MSDNPTASSPSSSASSDPTSSREDFVRHLRQKSQQAAEASVHHASLSQQYLDLSQKFSQLAEQAGSAELADLQQTLQAIEQQSPTVAPPTASIPETILSASPEVPPTPVRADAPPTVPDKPKDELASASGSTEIAAAKTPGKMTDAKKTSPRKLKAGRSGRRRWLERVRSVALSGKRVRVKAKKSDLKPRERTATEELKKGGSSLFTSACLFALALFIMSIISWQLEVDVPLDPIMAGFADEVQPVEEPMPVEPPEEEMGEQLEEETEEPVEEPEPEPEPEEEEPEPEEPEPEPEPDPTEVAMAEIPEPVVDTPTDVAAAAEAATDSAAESASPRSEAGKKAMLAKYGGSVASESAVSRALEWLVSVQNKQGYWDFIYVGEAGSEGTINNPIGGTAYALLPFLAAGQTHKEGNFQKQVGAGLTYLTGIGKNLPAGYDLRGMINKQSDDKEPNEAYYVHGAATLVLCEAYGMTKDRRLKRSAEGAVKFIVNSQDPRGGGWRYNPQEPGSTSVTAIQVMALMAAKKAGIKIPDKTLEGVMYYLDSVQVDKEGRYGYEIEKKQYKGSITAMALLCRMYLGWGREDGDMQAGVALLDKAGPYDNLYSLYFATQVMKNWGGEEWERWNTRFRDDLVAQQVAEGPGKGSWKPRTGAIHAKQGGRLLSTALATLTLEVYYRYKPLLPEQ